MARERTQPHVHALFGNTDIADGVPDACELSPSTGPVYLEDRLVLSLSFQANGEQVSWLSTVAGRMDECELPQGRRERPLERYRLWDDIADDWLADGPTVLRFENADVVELGGVKPVPVWTGAVDVRRRVIPVPDFGPASIAINGTCDLRWKRC